MIQQLGSPSSTIILVALSLLVGACHDNVAPTSTPSGQYVPPAPVMLDPPPGLIINPNEPTIAYSAAEPSYLVPVEGEANADLVMKLAAPDGRRTLEMRCVGGAAGTETVEFAPSGFHLPPGAVTSPSGDMMTCWNTVTGAPSRYTEGAPDPSRGMALYCRLIRGDRSMGAVHRVESPTVGCWLRDIVALADGSFRVLYKGDDGWFEANYANTQHGTYEAVYRDGRWSLPRLIMRVPNPNAELDYGDNVPNES